MRCEGKGEWAQGLLGGKQRCFRTCDFVHPTSDARRESISCVAAATQVLRGRGGLGLPEPLAGEQAVSQYEAGEAGIGRWWRFWGWGLSV